MPHQPDRPPRILIVEDEGIVATDIARCLEDAGFEVAGIAASAGDALAEAAASLPDLVLMDVRIQGDVDGIEAGYQLHKLYNLPIVYLTAHGDRETVERAKKTDPVSFLLKPFKPQELTNIVEISLNRVRAEKELREIEHSFGAAMEAVGDAVFTTDAAGEIRFMNPAAELLTGCRHAEAMGRPILEVLQIVDEPTGGTIHDFRCRLGLHQALPSSDPPDQFCIVAQEGARRWTRMRRAQMTGGSAGIWHVAVLSDITNRKEAEQVLRRHADLLDQSNDAIYTLDRMGRVHYWNRGAERLYGIGRTDAAGQVWNQLLRITPPVAIADIETAIERDGRWRGEWIQTAKDGQEIVVESFVTASPGAPDQRMLLVTGRDITERKRIEVQFRELNIRLQQSIAEYHRVQQDLQRLNAHLDESIRKRTKELQESEERYRGLVENIKDYSILMLDPEGVIRSWTIAAERIKGYRAAEIVGRNFSCLFSPEDIARNHPENILRSAGETGHFEEEGWRVRKDGSTFWASVTLTALYDHSGALRGFSALTRDISERKKNQEILRQSEEQFRTLLNCAPDAIVVVDDQGKLVLVNARAETLFGYQPGELNGQPVETLIPGRLRNAHYEHRAHYRQAPRVRPIDAGRDLFGLRKSGEQFPAEISLSPVQTPQGTWVAAGIRDITERRAVEEKLVAERLRAEQANRTKSAFLASMSHEIRTPMNSILGMADLLWESELSLDQRQYVEVFRRAGSSLLALINDILDFSKIETGQLELESVAFDLVEVMDEAIELIAPRARAKNLVLLSRVLPGVATWVMGDPTRLRQVLINLLGNAAKFTTQGQIMLTAEVADRARPSDVRIAVSDTGIGIAPGKMDSIFGDFTQADDSITREYGGTGLGLSISRRLVQRMGGELAVTSTLGKGSTFYFTANFPPAASAKPPSADVADLNGRRVMIIDNNSVNCLILREALSTWGLVGETFVDTGAALENLAGSCESGQEYSLAIVDKRLPHTDGFEVSEHIRKISPSLPIVMLSSDDGWVDSMRIAAADLAGYAVKPVRRADLLRLVCRAVNNSLERKPAGGLDSQPRKAASNTPGLRILLAEDSLDNQFLVRSYLKGTPHTLTVTEDGVAAVDAFRNASFDLILMDLQMPRLDGLAAARSIRTIEAERHSAAVPIVALSANARREDVALSRNSGCDTHLFKPISKSRLLAAIEEFGPSAASRTSHAPLVAESGRGLTVHPSAQMAGMQARYLSTRRAEVAALFGFLAAAEFDKIRVAGHNMKGTGGAYGFPALTAVGAAIETAAKASDANSLRLQFEELTRLLATV